MAEIKRERESPAAIELTAQSPMSASSHTPGDHDLNRNPVSDAEPTSHPGAPTQNFLIVLYS